MNTFEKVREILVDALNCEAEDVKMEADINEDLGADSLAVVELIMALEDEFSISLLEEEAQGLKYVKDVVALIDSKK